MSPLKKQLQEIVENFQKSNPKGGTFHISANSLYNEEAVKILNSLTVVAKAELVQLGGRSGYDIKIEVESIPTIQFSYDGGKSWT